MEPSGFVTDEIFLFPADDVMSEWVDLEKVLPVTWIAYHIGTGYVLGFIGQPDPETVMSHVSDEMYPGDRCIAGTWAFQVRDGSLFEYGYESRDAAVRGLVEELRS